MSGQEYAKIDDGSTPRILGLVEEICRTEGCGQPLDPKQEELFDLNIRLFFQILDEGSGSLHPAGLKA